MAKSPISETVSPSLVKKLCCPRCGGDVAFVEHEAGSGQCKDDSCALSARDSFPVIGGQPVLIDFANSVIAEEDFRKHQGNSYIKRVDRATGMRSVINRIMGSNPVSADNATIFIETVMKNARSEKPVILVIGGGEAGAGTGAIWNHPDFETVSLDVYLSENTDLAGDANHLPFRDGAVDGVWIQAVLMYVLDPRQAAGEIHRVLSDNGALYAETAFMQQVTEGGHDFNRFTHSGHRWLFRHFNEVRAGAVTGPGTSLTWAIRYFWRALTGSNKVATALTLPFFWLRFFDRFAKSGYGLDAANGVYFLGTKSPTSLTSSELIDYYKGGRVAE